MHFKTKNCFDAFFKEMLGGANFNYFNFISHKKNKTIFKCKILTGRRERLSEND